MDKQTLYIILIIIIFNLLLINIFRLQKDIINIRNNTDKLQNFIDVSGSIKPNNYKKVSYINDNNNGIISKDVKNLMNDISELVPIDINKIYPSKEQFIPKYEQVNN